MSVCVCLCVQKNKINIKAFLALSSLPPRNHSISWLPHGRLFGKLWWPTSARAYFAMHAFWQRKAIQCVAKKKLDDEYTKAWLFEASYLHGLEFVRLGRDPGPNDRHLASQSRFVKMVFIVTMRRIMGGEVWLFLAAADSVRYHDPTIHIHHWTATLRQREQLHI